MKCTIKRIIRKDRNKEGKPYINKNNKPFTLMSLQVAELPDEWLSGFADDYNAEWKEEDMIDIAITEKQVGTQLYKNFKNLVQKSSRLDVLEENVKKLMVAIFSKTASEPERACEESDGLEKLGDEINPEKIPF